MCQRVSKDVTHCGLVALLGRPNVGKSTLLNHLLGQKISITSRKPQTTRHRIVGVKTEAGVQIVYVDTPGLHASQARAINRYMNRAARSAIADVDVTVLVTDRDNWIDADQGVLDELIRAGKPTVLAINKTDLITDKNRLLPFLETMAGRADFCRDGSSIRAACPLSRSPGAGDPRSMPGPVGDVSR